jgi:hypothetical protein
MRRDAGAALCLSYPVVPGARELPPEQLASDGGRHLAWFLFAIHHSDARPFKLATDLTIAIFVTG